MSVQRSVSASLGATAYVWLALVASCGRADSNVARWEGSVDSLGDSITVTTVRGTTRGGAPIVLDSARIVWRSDSLSRPIGVAAVAGQLAVLDHDRIFVVSPAGALVRVLGRNGDGPGEFRSPQAFGVSGDTLLVLDRGNLRLSAFAQANVFAGSQTITPAGEQTGDVAGNSLAVRDGALVTSWTSGMVHIGPPPQPTTVLWQPLNGAAADTLDVMLGVIWKQLSPGNLGPDRLFGPVPMAAVDRDGRVATTDGLAYCIRIVAHNQATIRRICRQWTPVPVTNAVTHPDWGAITKVAEIPDQRRGMLQSAIAAMPAGDRRNSIDRLRWDGSGRLWVRVVDSLQANLHPWLLGQFAELRPPHYQWDVFGADGRQLTEVRLPSRFDPQAFVGDTVYGIYELETGERALAAVTVGL